jgi:2-oxo-3-hexenedioate decarboxylase
VLDFKELAKYLIKAEEHQNAVSCITDKFPEFDKSMGYRVQNELINIKREQGHEMIAYKMGLTSQAKMTQMGVNEPIYGTIFDYMVVPNKGKIAMNNIIHPKVEAEIGFILEEEIEGPNITREEVLEKTKWVIPALEIIDSRFENFKFRLPDVIADNTSASRVVFGNHLFDRRDFEMDSIGVKLSINGELRAEGTSDAVLGNPADSVAMLANMMNRNGLGKIPKGTLVLTGGITEAVLFNQGDYISARYNGMGEVSFHAI